MTPKIKAQVSDAKKEIVKDLINLIKNKKTILIASIKNIPGSQFQEIVKKLRSKAIVKVPKKNLIFRSLDSSENADIKKLKEQIENSVAILFSDLDSFELAAELVKNKSPSKAKTGQEAPEDIEIPEGPTELVPGPAISELGGLGIQIQIQDGKIHIKEPKVIAKKGQKISQNAAEIMNKLDIKPFSIGFTPLASFDTKENKLYLDIKIDPEATIEELKISFGKALAFSVEIDYICEDTVKLLIAKAGGHEKALEKFAEVGTSEDKDNVNNKKASEDIGNNSKDQPSEASENKEENIQTPQENKPEGEGD